MLVVGLVTLLLIVLDIAARPIDMLVVGLLAVVLGIDLVLMLGMLDTGLVLVVHLVQFVQLVWLEWLELLALLV